MNWGGPSRPNYNPQGPQGPQGPQEPATVRNEFRLKILDKLIKQEINNESNIEQRTIYSINFPERMVLTTEEVDDLHKAMKQTNKFFEQYVTRPDDRGVRASNLTRLCVKGEGYVVKAADALGCLEQKRIDSLDACRKFKKKY